MSLVGVGVSRFFILDDLLQSNSGLYRQERVYEKVMLEEIGLLVVK